MQAGHLRRQLRAGDGVSAELEQSCEVCKAAKGQPCVNIITPGEPLPGREFHVARKVVGNE